MYHSIKISFTTSYLLPCNGGYVLIDTSYAGRFREFKRKLESKGIRLFDIKYLFLTHHHDDHSGFAQELRVANEDMMLITHQKSLTALRSGKPDPDDRPLNQCVGALIFLFNHLLKEKQDWSFPPVQLRPNDHIVREDDYNFLPSIGVKGKIIHTPGHTHDSMSLLLADGSAFVGDLAMDLLSFCGCHYRPIYVTGLDEVYQSWKKLIAHGANTIYSSHASKPFGVAELVKTIKRYGLD